MGSSNGVFGRPKVRAALLFGCCVVGYLLGAPREATDTSAASATAVSLVRDQRLSFDRYASSDKTGALVRNGSVYDGFPATTAFLLIPTAALELALGADPREVADSASAAGRTAQALTGAVLAAATVLLFFQLASLRARNRWTPLTATVLFAAGGPVWSSASRLPWTSGQVLLLITASLACLLGDRRWRDLAGGVAIGVAVLTRPTALAALLCLAVWLSTISVRRALSFLAGAVMGAVPLLALYAVAFGTLGPPWYGSHHLGGVHVVSVFGPLVSPARGLLVFSPFLALLALRLRGRRSESPEWCRLDASMLVATALVWGAVASCSCGWWGGWSLGPRLFTECMTFLCLPLIPVLDAMLSAGYPRWRRALAGVLAAWSVAINAALVTSFAPWVWNAQPNVDIHSARLWDWTDPPWLRR